MSPNSNHRKGIKVDYDGERFRVTGDVEDVLLLLNRSDDLKRLTQNQGRTKEYARDIVEVIETYPVLHPEQRRLLTGSSQAALLPEQQSTHWPVQSRQESQSTAYPDRRQTQSSGYSPAPGYGPAPQLDFPVCSEPIRVEPPQPQQQQLRSPHLSSAASNYAEPQTQSPYPVQSAGHLTRVNSGAPTVIQTPSAAELDNLSTTLGRITQPGHYTNAEIASPVDHHRHSPQPNQQTRSNLVHAGYSKFTDGVDILLAKHPRLFGIAVVFLIGSFLVSTSLSPVFQNAIKRPASQPKVEKKTPAANPTPIKSPSPSPSSAPKTGTPPVEPPPPR